MSPNGICVAQILAEGGERCTAPDATEQLVPGQAKWLDADLELRVQHHPLLEQGVEAGAIGAPRWVCGGQRDLDRLGGEHDHSGAQRRIREDIEENRVRSEARIHKLRLPLVGKGICIAAEGVELTQVEAEPFGQKLREDDAGERGRLVEGDGVVRRGVGGQQRTGLFPREVLAELAFPHDGEKPARP